MRDDGPAGGHRGVRKEEPDQAEADEPAEKLAAMKNKADAGAMPANVSEKIRPAAAAIPDPTTVTRRAVPISSASIRRHTAKALGLTADISQQYLTQY
jgi:hypothetical protein